MRVDVPAEEPRSWADGRTLSAMEEVANGPSNRRRKMRIAPTLLL
jgi:hypothetical protein